MGWKIVNGVMVRDTPKLDQPKQPTGAASVVMVLTCPECGKSYKTDKGYAKHLETH